VRVFRPKSRPDFFVLLPYREGNVFSQVISPSALADMLSVLPQHCIHEYVARVFMDIVLYRLPSTGY
jgi:hypothetical protein